MSLFSKDVGIDLGTANTLVYMKGKGIIMREPSVVAVDTKSDEVRCVGAEAKAVIGRTLAASCCPPPEGRVIADLTSPPICWRTSSRRPAATACSPAPGWSSASPRAYRGGAPGCP